MKTYLLIALGGALGSVARAWGSALALRLAGAGFPLGTIAINVLGSFVIGLFAARAGTSEDLRAFVMLGICGGFTTFSSFSLQNLELMREGRPGAALANIALSVLLCLLATAAGQALTEAASGPAK